MWHLEVYSVHYNCQTVHHAVITLKEFESDVLDMRLKGETEARSTNFTSSESSTTFFSILLIADEYLCNVPLFH